MAKPWGGAGAWAAEAEQAEAEAKAKGAAALPSEAFPSLEAAVAAKPKKKKAQTLTLSELTTGVYVGPGGRTRQAMSDSQRLTTEEIMLLPTGPRERNDEEIGGGLGRGFRDYGARGGGGGFGDRNDREPRDRSFGAGYDRGDREERRGMGPTREPRDEGPSRADEADNWGATKKPPTLSYGGSPSHGDRGGRGGGGGYDDHERNERRMSDRDLPSRADEVDNWGQNKKFVPMPAADGYGERRGGRGGVGFEERRGGGGGFDDGHGVISRADESANWGAAKKTLPAPPPPERRGGGGFESYNRDGGGPEADRWSRRTEIPPREDVARPAERRRLVLQPRTIPIDNPLPAPLNIDRNGENERPLSSHSTRSDRSVALSETNSLMSDTSGPRKPKTNPFGAARPREEVLAEKGQDYRKIDAELELKASRPSSSHSSRSSRPQTPEVAAGEGLHRPRSRVVSPFGEATPRERDSHYEDRGNRDWRKSDVDLHDRPAREEVKPPPEENNLQTVS